MSIKPSTMIPQPFRQHLIDAAGDAPHLGSERSARRIDSITAAAKASHPQLFLSAEEERTLAAKWYKERTAREAARLN